LEGAASRGGEQIDYGLDRFVGMVIGRFELAVGSVLGLGLMMKAAVGEGSAQPFMKELRKPIFARLSSCSIKLWPLR
jgi:hypothetical protein